MAITGLTGAPVHTGSWGLPDFGVTEFLQGKKSTSPQPARAQVVSKPQSSGGNVLGAMQGPQLPINQNRPSSGAGGTSGGFSVPQAQQSFDQGAPYEGNPNGGDFNFDALINPVLEQLSQSESAAQSIFGENQGNIEAGRQTSTKRLAQTQGEQNTLLDQNAVKQQAEGESASDQARRQFAEIQQGLQSRFGGTTGTGAFAAELAGRDTIGAIANIRQGVSQALQEIDNKKVQIKELGRIALEDIDNNAREQLTSARENLENTLSQIRAKRGELQANKAQMAMQAMQQYQALQADVNARNAAFKQQLYMKQQEANQRLADAQSRAKGIAESFKLYNVYQPKQTTPISVRYGSQGTVEQIGKPGVPFSIPQGSYLANIGTTSDKQKEQLDPNAEFQF